MDPIHPILPVPLNIPPVMPSTGAGRIDRDGRRDHGADAQEQADAQRRRREAAQRGQPSKTAQDEEGPHIDVKA